jgi:hypothetical protein
LVTITDHYKKQEQDTIGRKPGSPNVSQKRTSTKGKSPNNFQEQRKSCIGNSYDGGDKYHSKRVVKKSHTIHVSVKEKREVQKEGLEEPEAKFSTIDMEVEKL